MILDEIIKYEGNEEEFQKYRLELEKPIIGHIIYFDDKRKKYKGNLLNSLYEGKGILYNNYTHNQIRYKGYFSKGKYNGFGKLYNDNNELIYEGFFKDDKYNGKGIKYRNKKKIYEGHFLDDNLEGMVIEYFIENGKRKRKIYFSENKIKEKCYGILYMMKMKKKIIVAY